MEMPVSTPDNAAPIDDGVLRPVIEYPALTLIDEAYPAAMGGFCLTTPTASGLKFVLVAIGVDSSAGARFGPGSSAWPAESCAMVNAGKIKTKKKIFSPFTIKSV